MEKTQTNIFPTVMQQAFTAGDDAEEYQCCKLGAEVPAQLHSKFAHHDTTLTGLDLSI